MRKFPSDNIDPKKKREKEWILATSKAIWDNSKTFSSNVFYHGRENFKRLRDYANGRQPESKYKNIVQAKDANGESTNVRPLDYTILPIIPKFKKIAVGKIDKVGYNLVATAIDSIARDDEEEYFSEQKAKIKMLEELSDVPGIEGMIDLKDDDARSLEEIKIKQEYSYKHNAAIESEKALDLVFSNNNYDQILNQVNSDLFDFGVGGVREYFDENNVIKIKHAKMGNMITSYCEDPFFRDADYMGEIIYMSIEDIQSYGEFSDEEIEEIKNQIGGRESWIRRSPGLDYDDNKIPVLSFEKKSFDKKVFEERTNRFGNKKINRTKFSKEGKKGTTVDGKEVIYKGHWVIGTDYVFDYGLQTNMKRPKGQLKKTSFSWHLVAPNQDEMEFFGVTESMIPVADQIQISWLTIQNLLLNVTPPGIAFDLSALENINIGHAGEKWLPRQAIELYKKRGDMAYRSKREDGEYVNPEPIKPINNPLGQEIGHFIGLIDSLTGILRGNIGFNEITDGSTPDPRTLNGVANLAYQSTTNALNHIIQGVKHLNENVADSLIIRIQDAFNEGENHYKHALGINSERFWKVEPSLGMHQISLKFEDKPDDNEKAMLDAKIANAETKDQITVADAVYIDTIDNLKEKAMVLAYLVKKRMAERQAIDMQNIQANSQAQQESAMIAEQMKQKTLEIEYSLKNEHQRQGKEADFIIEQLRAKTRIDEADVREAGRAFTKQLENEGKERIKEMESKNPDNKDNSK